MVHLFLLGFLNFFNLLPFYQMITRWHILQYFPLLLLLSAHALADSEKHAIVEDFQSKSTFTNGSIKDNPVRTYFITKKALEELGVQLHNSRDRLGNSQYKTESDLTFPIAVDLAFRAYYLPMSLYQAQPVLEVGLQNGFVINPQKRSVYKTSLNQPFVESISPTSYTLRSFVNSVTNGTSKAGDKYGWSSGSILDYDLTTSRVRNIISFCYEMHVFFPDNRTDRISLMVYYNDRDRSYQVYFFPSEHGSPLCEGEGDSLILRGHGEESQRLITGKANEKLAL